MGDIFALTDGGISVYGAMIGGALGGFIYVLIWKPHFPRWLAFDAAAPGMILGQAVGRLGDTINGEHFAKASDLPWAFRYTHPSTEGPWASIVDGVIPSAANWFRGQTGALAEAPVPVHPVAGGYELILDFMILGGLLLLRRTRLVPGWGFVFYVLAYAAVRGLLALLRTDEQTAFGGLSVPQLLAILTGLLALAMAWYLWRNPPARPEPVALSRALHREEARTRRRGAPARDAARTPDSAPPSKPPPPPARGPIGARRRATTQAPGSRLTWPPPPAPASPSTTATVATSARKRARNCSASRPCSTSTSRCWTSMPTPPSPPATGSACPSSPVARTRSSRPRSSRPPCASRSRGRSRAEPPAGVSRGMRPILIILVMFVHFDRADRLIDVNGSVCGRTRYGYSPSDA